MKAKKRPSKKRVASTDEKGVRTSGVYRRRSGELGDVKEKFIETPNVYGYGDRKATVTRKNRRKRTVKEIDADTGRVTKKVYMSSDKGRGKKKVGLGPVKSKSKVVGQKRAGKMIQRLQSKQDRMDKRASR